MNNVLLQVETLGGLRIKAGDKVLLEQGARINKPWELLIFLLLNMDEPLTNEQICEALWEDDEVANPAGALKNAAYSLRKHLTAAGLPADCVMTRDREYCWNPATPVQLDVQTLNALFRQGRSEKDPARQLELCRDFLDQYTGDFLPSLSGRRWVLPKASALSQKYLSVVLRACDLLLAGGERSSAQEVLDICSRALLLEPLSEELYLRHFTALKQLNMKNAILNHYPIISNMFLDETGEVLGPELQSIFRWASEGTNTVDDIHQIQKDLDEVTRDDRPIRGAYFCPYEVFKHMYHMVVRSAVRVDNTVVLLLVGLQSTGGQAMSKQETARVMLQLREIIKNTLRKGDVFSRYSRNQYVLMLSVRQPGDSGVVAERLLKGWKASGLSSSMRIDISTGLPEPIV
ncbi:MAG TPA: hypothetical protein IAA01_09765 [Candidatus Fournierella excrementavium]|uniref:AfsR/SARP family transcriptional regulator n=1 Tax=Candidatus Allofournierella excrementavium TaxID=2838591 RepID=UPI0015AA28D0|nr:hypothetical protein [Candidatus Fournierella excrementavium]